MSSTLLDAPPAPAADAPPLTVTGAAPVDGRYAQQGVRRERRRDALTVAAGVFVSAAVALFLADHGSTYFTTLAGTIKGIGVIAGLVAMASMMLMLVLVARVPFVDRTLGQDRATAAHAAIGRTMVAAIFAHGAFILSGYALGNQADLVSTFTHLWAASTDFVWAVVAFGLLCVVGVSSMVAVRRRYPYEAWYAIHLLTYAAIAASIPHQFSMSGMFAPGTIGRAYWIAALVAVGGLLLAFRVVRPVVSTLRHDVRVSRVVPVGPDAVSIEMTGRGLDRLAARGGHWLTWRFLTPQLALQPHPFSLSADPTSTTMRVTVRNLGAGTARLAQLQPGIRVALEGPYGMFTDEARTRDDVVMVGAGIGIAPVRALLESTRVTPGRAVVVLRASTPDELYLYDEIERLCREKGAYLYVLVGHRAGASWVSQDAAGAHLTDFAPWAAGADLFVCGPDAWMDAVLADAELCGIPAGQIHDERFDW